MAICHHPLSIHTKICDFQHIGIFELTENPWYLKSGLSLVPTKKDRDSI